MEPHNAQECNPVDRQTISDFGVQWTHFPDPDSSGWFGGVNGQFKDQIEPLIHISEIKGMNVCDVGSGMGRVVRNLFEAGAARVTAIEPSEAACSTLRANTREFEKRITLICATGEHIPRNNFDLVITLVTNKFSLDRL